jgi:hypothetical protein
MDFCVLGIFFLRIDAGAELARIQVDPSREQFRTGKKQNRFRVRIELRRFIYYFYSKSSFGRFSCGML